MLEEDQQGHVRGEPCQRRIMSPRRPWQRRTMSGQTGQEMTILEGSSGDNHVRSVPHQKWTMSEIDSDDHKRGRPCQRQSISQGIMSERDYVCSAQRSHLTLVNRGESDQPAQVVQTLQGKNTRLSITFSLHWEMQMTLEQRKDWTQMPWDTTLPLEPLTSVL